MCTYIILENVIVYAVGSVHDKYGMPIAEALYKSMT